MTESNFQNPELITIGHILIDIRAYVDEFPVPDISAKIKGEIQYSPGGSATNTAVAARRLGIQSGICSILGLDDYGMTVIKELIAEKVDVSNIRIHYHKETGVSLLIINEKGTPIIIQTLGANEPFPINWINHQAIQEASHLHMTGTDLNALEAAARFAKESTKRKISVSFDPGRSKSHLGYEALMPILKNTDYLIINRTEAARMSGLSIDHDDIMKIIDKLRSTIPAHIKLIIKGGSKETIVKTDEEFFAVPPYKVKVFDTIGAGDAFAGSFITALLRNKSLKDAIIMAHAAAGYKIQYGGAQSSPTSEQLSEFLELHKNEITARDLK
ncbi:MAG TPA: carbohydrate kinase family protein [Candidatus Deferrimicrobium sp.]|nr:carbohydrate kinase family protein [Candidatus Deferrimicrobium sp.]